MGYEVHITRKPNWFDDAGPVISLEEWIEYVLSDPEMQECYRWIDDEVPPRLALVDVAGWKAHPTNSRVYLCHVEDRNSTRDPDNATLKKMHKIAIVLNARVQGHEGEEYNEEGATLSS